jgi:hypothetical protein
MVHSPEVHLGIKISHAEVEHKSLFIFNYKNHLDRFIINTKQFIIKDLHSKFVKFLVQNLDRAYLTTYPKFSFRSWVDF